MFNPFLKLTKIRSFISSANSGARTLDPGSCLGRWIQDPAPWIQNPGSRTLDPGSTTQGPGS